MKYALFAYDFNHTKTKDFILVLEHLGYKLDCILAAPKIKLNYPEPLIRIKVREKEYFHPREIAEMFDIPYFVVPHKSDECVKILKERDIDIGIIGGARILPKKVIEAVNYGIINFHPGLIPQNRGLDNLKWAIHLGIPQGVTSHFIDHRVDAGRIILQKKVPVYLDDTLFDIDRRLYDTQLELIKPTLEAIQGKSIEDFPLVKSKEKPRSVMPYEIEKNLLQEFEEYKKKFGIPYGESK